MSDNQRRGYWGVIPGEIKHDPKLTIAARYLYIILSSMAYEDGYCWPSNEFLAGEMGLSKRRVVELLGLLRDCGYIKIIMKSCEDTPNGERRYIYCGMFPERVEMHEEGCEISHGEDAEDCTEGGEKPHGGDAKNTFAYSSRKTKKKYNPIAPKKSAAKTGNQVNAEQFDAFWHEYPKKKDKEASKRAWKKINPDAELFAVILSALKRDKRSEDWTKEGGKYIPYPSKWLNGRRWEDEDRTPVPSPDTGPGQPLRGEGVRYL